MKNKRIMLCDWPKITQRYTEYLTSCNSTVFNTVSWLDNVEFHKVYHAWASLTKPIKNVYLDFSLAVNNTKYEDHLKLSLLLVPK